MKRLVLAAALAALATAGLAPAAHAVGVTVCAGGVTLNLAGHHAEQSVPCQRIEVPPAG